MAKTIRSSNYNHKKNLVLLFLFYSFLFFFAILKATSAYAQEEYFSDNFDSLDGTKWNFYAKTGTITTAGGYIHLSAENTISFPFVSSKETNLFPLDKDFVLTVDMQYLRTTTKGTGLAIGTVLPSADSPIDTPINDPLFSKYKLFHIWQDNVTNFSLRYAGECYGTSSCNVSNITKFQSDNPNLEPIKVELRYINKKYLIYLNGDLKYTSPETEIIPSTIWFGNNSRQGAGDKWTNFKIDKISISSELTESSSPIFFVPGMFSCYNKALISGGEPTSDRWQLLSLAKSVSYKNLINSLNSQLEEDKDWYLFCYDWRKNLETNAEKLYSYIEERTEPEQTVNLIGHSMGGLITRYLLQKYPEKVNKVVSLGSAHEGVLFAYPFWEGGQIWHLDPFKKTLAEFLLKRQIPAGSTKIQTIRNLYPSVRDFLPTFDFLIDERTDQYKPVATHLQQNISLNDFNQNLTTEQKQKILNIYGSNQETLEALRVVSAFSPAANWVHQTLGLWEDGEPTHLPVSPLAEYTDQKKDYSPAKVFSTEGDGTVLARSAQIADAVNFGVSTAHSELPQATASIQQIFDFLGIRGAPVAESPLTIKNTLLFSLHSPAQMTVTDPGGFQAGFSVTGSPIPDHFYDPEEKLIIIPNYLAGQYQVSITGENQGKYALLLVKTDESGQTEIKEYSFPTAAGQIDNLLFEPDNSLEIITPTDTPLYLNLKTKIEKLAQEIGKNNLFKTTLQALSLAENLSRKNRPLLAAAQLKIAAGLFVNSFLKNSPSVVISFFDQYEPINEDFINLYLRLAPANYGPWQAKRLEIDLKLEKRLLTILEKKINHSSYEQALVFQSAAELLTEAENAYRQADYNRCEIILVQTKATLLDLSR